LSRREHPALGSLRDRVEVFSNSQIIDGSGGLIDNFVSLGAVWARVESKPGVLSFNADGRDSKISHVMTLRFRTDLKPGDRINYRGQNVEILSAQDLNGRRAYLICQCSEIDSTG